MYTIYIQFVDWKFISAASVLTLNFVRVCLSILLNTRLRANFHCSLSGSDRRDLSAPTPPARVMIYSTATTSTDGVNTHAHHTRKRSISTNNYDNPLSILKCNTLMRCIVSRFGFPVGGGLMIEKDTAMEGGRAGDPSTDCPVCQCLYVKYTYMCVNTSVSARVCIIYVHIIQPLIWPTKIYSFEHCTRSARAHKATSNYYRRPSGSYGKLFMCWPKLSLSARRSSRIRTAETAFRVLWILISVTFSIFYFFFIHHILYLCPLFVTLFLSSSTPLIPRTVEFNSSLNYTHKINLLAATEVRQFYVYNMVI